MAIASPISKKEKQKEWSLQDRNGDSFPLKKKKEGSLQDRTGDSFPLKQKKCLFNIEMTIVSPFKKKGLFKIEIAIASPFSKKKRRVSSR